MPRPKTKTIIKKIKKRNGDVVPFEVKKIERAIWLAAKAAGGENRARARYLAGLVVKELEARFNKTIIPEVEQAQDVAENILLKHGHNKTYRAFTLYRDLHGKLRDISSLVDSDELIEKYLKKDDWRVKENANMTYSLQGLNSHVSSIIASNFWLNKIYPRDIRKAHAYGDIHLHDLASLSAYCCGWDLKDLLVRGFGGVKGKLNSAPPKHLETALGQLVNFFYTLQGECYSEDTQILTQSGWKYFYEVDKNDKVFTLNNETNEIELQKPVKFFEFDNERKLYNFKSKKLDLLVTPSHNMVVDQYCPGCKKRYYRKIIKAKDFNVNIHFIPKNSTWGGKEEKYFVLPGIKIKQYRGLAKRYDIKNIKPKKILMDDWLAFFGFWLAEGSVYKRKRNRKGRKRPYYEYLVRIGHNKGKKADKFERVLKRLPFNYGKKTFHPKKVEFYISSKQLYLYLGQFGKAGDKCIPKTIKNLSKKQLEILFTWLMEGDGYVGYGNTNYYTKSKRLADDVQEIVLKLGWNANIYLKTKKNFKWYDVSLSKTRYFKFSKKTNIKKIKYQGKVYCLEVPNSTLYVRRNGRACWCGNSAGAVAVANFDTYLAPFIAKDKLSYREVKQAMQEFLYNMNVPTRTGFQTPFTNVTLDLVPPKIVGEEAVIIGGKPIKAQYKEFQKEMDMFNKAFAEVMGEGDAQGRVFTFPIPTYSITKDFDWDNSVLEPIFEMTRKYGIPYWANYIGSDMEPEDARSMCFAATERIFYKNNNQSTRIGWTDVKRLVDNYLVSSGRRDIELLLDNKSFKVKRVIKLKNKEKKLIKITLKNGESLRMTFDHPAMVIKDAKLVQIAASELKEGIEIPLAKYGYEGELGDYELGKFVGLYLSEGSVSKEGCVYFSFNRREKGLINFVTDVAQKRFATPIQVTHDPRWQTTQVWLKSRVVVELVRRFCSGAKARFKQLKSQLFSMNRDFRQGVLDGVYLGDGYLRDMEFHTTNRKLRNQVGHLASSLGICYFRRNNHKNTKDGEVFSSYVLRISANSYNCFKKGFPSLKKRPSTVFREYKDFYGLEIKKVEKVLYEGFVYDFEIEGGEHLFQLANGIVTHNCCRLRLDNRVLRRRGGLFAANPLTGSLSVVTINLPRIGFLARDKRDFKKRLAQMMRIAKKSLVIKREAVEQFTKQGLYPYCRYYLDLVYARFGKYWQNHFNTIGILGMNEALENFMGKGIYDPEGKAFAEELMDFMRKRLLAFQKETGEMFNLEATPAEGTCYRFARIDKEKYPKIKVANEKDLGKNGAAPFYTNSTHLPVDYTDDIFEALDHQDSLQTKYNGGTVLHGFLGESLADTDSVKVLIKKIAENYHLPYFTLTPTFSICPKHGYLAGEHKYCPKCDREIGYNKSEIRISKSETNSKY